MDKIVSYPIQFLDSKLRQIEAIAGKRKIKSFILEAIEEKLEMGKRYYRPHRGSLEDAMKECNQVAGIKDIIDRYPEYDNITIKKESTYDIRTLWDTHYVLADIGEHKQQCIGMCNFYE